jgi:hypothetical protein
VHEDEQDATAVEAAARILRERFARADDPTHGAMSLPYCREMFIECLAEWECEDPGGGWIGPALVQWRNRPANLARDWFASGEDALARATGDAELVDSFIAGTAAMLAETPLGDNGLVRYPWGPFWGDLPEGRQLVLVDAMQEYASRLASAAALGGDPVWFDLAVAQLVGHAALLRNQETGLWSIGYNWGVEPGTRSPGAWSRGHGWLLRGIVETLRWLPTDHGGRSEVRRLLVDVLDALAPRRDPEGMWHTLVHRPLDDSAPETSGTALIAYGIARAVVLGEIDAKRWTPVVRQAISAVRRRIGPDGVIAGACVGPGLLLDDSEQHYLRTPIAPDDPHGPPCVIYGLLGARLLDCRLAG